MCGNENELEDGRLIWEWEMPPKKAKICLFKSLCRAEISHGPRQILAY
jgi:hypothetical protein